MEVLQVHIKSFFNSLPSSLHLLPKLNIENHLQINQFTRTAIIPQTLRI